MWAGLPHPTFRMQAENSDLPCITIGLWANKPTHFFLLRPFLSPLYHPHMIFITQICSPYTYSLFHNTPTINISLYHMLNYVSITLPLHSGMYVLYTTLILSSFLLCLQILSFSTPSSPSSSLPSIGFIALKKVGEFIRSIKRQKLDAHTAVPPLLFHANKASP